MSFLSFSSLRLDKELNKIYIICIGDFMIRFFKDLFIRLFGGAIYRKDDEKKGNDDVDEI